MLSNRTQLAAENLALRQQLAVLQRSCKRPRLRQRDRTFWVCLARLWKNWASYLVIVKPETVIRWHRQGFKLYWRWKSRKTGRPKVDPAIQHLIRRMSKENPTWGAPRIQSGEAPRYLLSDRDTIYAETFRRRIAGMRINEVIIWPRSPWQNPYAERVIGSIRRECLDHVIVLGEDHLHRILTQYVRYYNGSRTHLSLRRNAPLPREVESRNQGRAVAIPQVGGLHHRYARAA